jgi:hypothetical protein
MDSIKQNETKVKLGRPSLGRSKKEHKEYLKHRSREYYSDPERKVQQVEKMRLYRDKNRAKINQKKRAKSARIRLQKNLKRIWVCRGLIVGTL